MQAIYSAGQVQVKNASTEVIGLGTNFLNYALPGATFQVAGETTTYDVAEITGAHRLVLATPYSGTSRKTSYELRANSSTLFAEAKRNKIGEMRDRAAAEIASGLSNDALGAAHNYPTQIPDQININGQMLRALDVGALGEPYKVWCQNSSGAWARRDHTAAQIKYLSAAMNDHVAAIQNHYAGKLTEIDAATTINDMEAITW